MFSIFSLSFGNRIPKIDYSGVNFLGRILENYDFNADSRRLHAPLERILLTGHAHGRRLYLRKSAFKIPFNYSHLKPAVNLAFNTQKITLINKSTTLLSQTRREDRAITIYPQLPHNFLLYFKDRQTVHIELIFNIISDGETNYIAVKRKISSGNLEADLLTMRYINHYLFIQQANFSVNNWQTVMIDLSEAEVDRRE